MITGLVIAALVAICLLALQTEKRKLPKPSKPEAPPPTPPDYSHLDDHPVQIVGELNYQAALIDLCGPYTDEGRRTRVSATLIREPGNKHDSNAIRVEVQGRTVGYIDRQQAAQWAPRMDVLPANARQAVVDAIVMGGWRRSDNDTGLYGVRIARPDLPRKPRAKKAAKA